MHSEARRRMDFFSRRLKLIHPGVTAVPSAQGETNIKAVNGKNASENPHAKNVAHGIANQFSGSGAKGGTIPVLAAAVQTVQPQPTDGLFTLIVNLPSYPICSSPTLSQCQLLSNTKCLVN